MSEETNSISMMAISGNRSVTLACYFLFVISMSDSGSSQGLSQPSTHTTQYLRADTPNNVAPVTSKFILYDAFNLKHSTFQCLSCSHFLSNQPVVAFQQANCSHKQLLLHSNNNLQPLPLSLQQSMPPLQHTQSVLLTHYHWELRTMCHSHPHWPLSLCDHVCLCFMLLPLKGFCAVRCSRSSLLCIFSDTTLLFMLRCVSIFKRTIIFHFSSTF